MNPTENRGMPARIEHIYIAMTDRCSLNCIMCSTTISKTPVEHEMSVERWESVIRNITRFPIGMIAFGGGEPLSRAIDLTRLIPLIASKGVPIHIVTNTTCLDEKFLESVLAHKNRVTFLLSVDGLEKENDAIRGQGVFQKVMNAARLLQSYQWPFLFTSVLMPENVCRFVDFLEFLTERYPAVPVDIQPVITNNEIYYLRNGFCLNEAQLNSLRDVLSFLHKNKRRMKIARPLPVIDRYWDYFRNEIVPDNRCLMGTQSFNINYRGNLWICGKEIDFPLYQHPFEDVFNTEAYLKEMERVKRCKSPCLAGLVVETKTGYAGGNKAVYGRALRRDRFKRRFSLEVESGRAEEEKNSTDPGASSFSSRLFLSVSSYGDTRGELGGHASGFSPHEDFFRHRDLIDKLVKDIRELEIREIYIGGNGDPFFYKEKLFYFLEALKNEDLFISVMAGVFRLNEANLERLTGDGLISRLGVRLDLTLGSQQERALRILRVSEKYKRVYHADHPLIDILSPPVGMQDGGLSRLFGLLAEFKLHGFFFLSPEESRGFSPEQQEGFLKDRPLMRKKFDDLKIKSNIDRFRFDPNPDFSGFGVFAEDEARGSNGSKNEGPFSIMIESDGTLVFGPGKKDACQKNYRELVSLKQFLESEGRRSFLNGFKEK